MRAILLDSDVLIKAFENNEKYEELLMLKRDSGVIFKITPLILFEILRDPIKCISMGDREIKLRELDVEPVEIRKAHARRAAELFRLGVESNADWARRDAADVPKRWETWNKRLFDLFHCVCAEAYDYEFISFNEKDIPKIKKLMQEHPLTASRQQ
jgi:predicted nucleic acid-binding protein